MPFVSTAQNAWAHTPAGEKALGGKEEVKEWEHATDYKDLPAHVHKTASYSMAHKARNK